MTATVLRHSRSLLPKLVPQPTSTVRRTISTFPYIFQVPEPQEAPAPPAAAPLPPNPSTGRSAGVGLLDGHALNPVRTVASVRMKSQTFDLSGLMDELSAWTTCGAWHVIKEMIELWIRSSDASGKPNKPDVHLFNLYLRANLKVGASVGEVLDVFAQIQDYQIAPDTETYMLVNAAIFHARKEE